MNTRNVVDSGLFGVAASAPEIRRLPSPNRDRWQPLRSGLVNIYHYDEQEFEFEQGHLLLRGNNGTGKSRVLALQLPFLLDGEVSPARVEPDRDPAKRIEWNLLLGRHTDRMGYTWIEFGRRRADGAAEYVTLGCGLSAVHGRGLVDKWFFVTTHRIGERLSLTTPAHQVFNRERLAEALADNGRVYRTAREYRLAVDQALFKLGEARYDALVNLLIQLRQPQLSRKLEEADLSAALSEALTPISAGIIGDVAEAFRGLEQDRRTLDDYRAAQVAVEAFLGAYRVYVQVGARRRAGAVRAAQNAYEGTMRKLRAAETERDSTGSALQRCAARIASLDHGVQAADGRVAALDASPEMRSARALDASRRQADERQAEADRARDDDERAAESRRQSGKDRDAAHRKSADALAEARRSSEQAAGLAAAAGLESDHRDAIGLLDLPQLRDASAVDTAVVLLEDASSRRSRAARHVRALTEQVVTAEAALRSVKHSQAELAGQLDEAMEEAGRLQGEVRRAGEGLLRGYGAWHASLVELSPASPHDVASAFTEWASVEPEGSSPVRHAVEDAMSGSVRDLAVLRAGHEQRVAAAKAELEPLVEERARAEGGYHEPPPPPHTRDRGARSDRPGVTLWQSCEFSPLVDEATSAGIEAALEGSGLLDAWITPDGSVLRADEHDTVIISGDSPRLADGASMASVLRPSIDRDDARTAAITDERIEGVLARIGLGESNHAVWVDAAGRWRVGPLRGAWSKAAPDHIGQGAREAARRRRLRELSVLITAADDAVHAAEAALHEIDRRSAVAEREGSVAPDDAGFREARARAAAATQVCVGLRARLAHVDAKVASHRAALTAVMDERDRDASVLGVTPWLADLQALEDAIRDYVRGLDHLWPSIRYFVAACEEAASAEARFDTAAADEARRSNYRHEAEGRAAAAAAERDALQETVGAGVDAILAQLAEARQRASAIREEQLRVAEEQTTLRVQQVGVERDVEFHEATLGADTERRTTAIASFARYAGTRLLAVACPSITIADPVGWSVSHAVDVARQVDDALATVDSGDEAWGRNQKGVFRHMTALTDALLPYNYDPVGTLEDEVLVVTVPFQGRTCTMAELPAALSSEVEQRQTILDAREREVIENHLVGEVATHLHERLHAAEAWVRQVNDQLQRRPTSTGMTLRFAWQVAEDGPPGLIEARRRLLGAGGTWSPQERQGLGDFLQAQIRAVREANESGTWQDHLAAALDYRRWHRFAVERQQDGQWKRLTKRTHGTGSGGEKAIALTIPQFAAAAAHYQSADPAAPRLILLDEAFVGVDSDMRGKCVALLQAFDLDFVMTSEREWCCYAAVPGVAIYQLSTRPGIDAVYASRWVWNGRELFSDELPSASADASGTQQVVSAASRSAEADRDGRSSRGASKAGQDGTP